MVKKYLIQGGVILLLLSLAFALGRYTCAEKVVTKTEIVEVVKEVEVEKEVTAEKMQTKTVIKEFPDGTKITEIFEVKESTIFIEKETEVESVSTENEVNIVENKKPQYKFSAIVDVVNIESPVYGVGVERRIFGPVFAGAFIKQNKEYGITISMEF